ncbi:MAG: protein kinase [Myxococcales bacterium]|nr:protein kinase [Myxococcales bacterium]
MPTADFKDDAAVPYAMADTIDSGSRPAAQSERDLADSGADTLLSGKQPGDGDKTVKARPATAKEAAVDDLLGVTLNERYEVTAKLGQGGMGAVYEARHTVIGKRVALKVLLDKHAERDQSVARLKQEARLASSIGHKNIVDITDFGTTETGRTFVVMEYLDGESLGSLISKDGRLDSLRAIRIAQQIASALGAAHAKGIVHRDIKPENIFVMRRDDEDFVKVLDFGISKSLVSDDEDVRLTQTGMVLGTPLYMSPEQAQGDDNLDHRIDIYALGVILYEAITGEVPFRGKNYLNILTQVISDEPKQASEYVPGLDHNLESVICKAMAKDREERYQSMEEFASDLAGLDLVDPESTSSKITAARWRRNQKSRSKATYAAWLGGVVLVAGVSTIGVTTLMGDEHGGNSSNAVVATTTAFDAAPKIAEPDARPAFIEAHIFLESDPLGATIYEGSLQVCAATPCSYEPPKTGDQKKLRVVHEGYVDGSFTVTPELHDRETLTIKLKAVPKALPEKGRRSAKRNGRSGAKSTNKPPKDTTTNGGRDTIGNPF